MPPLPNRKPYSTNSTAQPYMKINAFPIQSRRFVFEFYSQCSDVAVAAAVAASACSFQPVNICEFVHIHVEGILRDDNTEILPSFFHLVKWVFVCEYAEQQLLLLVFWIFLHFAFCFFFCSFLSRFSHTFLPGRWHGWMCVCVCVCGGIVAINASH